MGVVGFDLGNESCVVAVARERGVSVVLNDESKGETPAIVCFGEKQRFLGTAGAACSMMNPKNSISQIKRLLGRQFSDPELQRDLKALPFTVTEGPDGFPLIHAWYLGESRTFKPTQLLAMVLSDMKSIAEKNLNDAVVDCCIGIPVYFTDLQRRAVLDAAIIAGLHPLRLLHETTATAMAYGIYKMDLAENDQLNIAFVDIGHASMQVCIARLKKGQLEILAHSFDRCLGGRDFDEALFQYFAAKFKEKYKIDVYQNARASLRLRIACEKLKKVLSANPEAPLNIECLMEEKDVKGFIRREDFEKISIPILERVRKPLEKALSQSGLTVENIDAVEVVGSGSRVPAIIRILTEFFRKEPRRTMNSSECVAKGCALECAIHSSAFELQEFQVNESFPFPIAFSWRGTAPDTQNGVADDQVIAIGFPKGNQIPCIKNLTFFRSGTFTVHVQYADVSELQAPAKISSYTIGPFQSTKSERVKVKVKVRLNPHGIVSIDSAASYEEENVEVPENEANKIKKANIPVVEHIYGGMCPADVQKATEEEFAMAFQDRVMEETKDKKNAVEAYVYDMRNKLHGKYQGFVTDAEREGLTAKLQEVEDWLYEDGEDVTKGIYIAKLEELKKLGNPIEKRYKMLTEDDNFLEGQEGVDTETVEGIAESHAPSVEPSHACEGVDKHCLVPSTLEVPRSGLPRNCREDDYLVSRYPDGSASVRLGAEEEIRLYPRTLFAEVREEHKAILSNIFELWPSTFVRFDGVSSISRKLAFDSLVSFVEVLENMSLPQATPEDFDCARDGLEALKHFRLEIGWLCKRLDQMASLVELPVAQNQLEEVGKEIEEMEEVVRQLKEKKQGLMRRVSELESAGSGGFFDLSSHAGQGLRG